MIRMCSNFNLRGCKNGFANEIVFVLNQALVETSIFVFYLKELSEWFQMQTEDIWRDGSKDVFDEIDLIFFLTTKLFKTYPTFG